MPADLSENRVKAPREGLTLRRSGRGEVDGFFRTGVILEEAEMVSPVSI